MIIKETFRMNAPRDAVAAFFLDIDKMARCIPGVEDVVEQGADEYEGSMAVGVGPIRARFSGNITLDRSAVPERFTAHGRGKDRATGSSVVVDFTALLRDLEEETEVDVTADVTIRGRLGRFGTGVIQATATELVRDFTACANAYLAQEATSAADVAAPRAGGIGRIIWRGLLTYLQNLWRRLRGVPTDSSGDSGEHTNAGS